MNWQSSKMHLVGLLLLMTLGLCACKKEPPTEEMAVWLSVPGNSYSPKTGEYIDSLFAEYKKIKITQLFWFNNLRDLRYRDSSFILLDTLIAKAHRAGMKIHPVYYPGAAFLPDGKYDIRKEWLIVNKQGDTIPNLNLANEEVRKYIINDLKEYLKHDIDGIHLDYIRFPLHQSFSYDSITQNRFKAIFGKRPEDGACDGGNMLWCEWIQWNAGQVTELVKEMHHLLKESGKDRMLSAAVFPDNGFAKVEIGQDWHQWAKEKLVDMVCPMLYTENTDLFEQYVKQAVRVAGTQVIVLPGIATNSVHNQSTPAEVIQQIHAAYRAGAEGVTFFRLGLDKMVYIDSIQCR